MRLKGAKLVIPVKEFLGSTRRFPTADQWSSNTEDP